MKVDRDYIASWLTVREVNEEQRIIEGIATTPTKARDGDVLESSGIQFKLPLPFLWRHKEPFGNVTHASVTPEGIKVRIQVGPAGVSQAIDEYWGMVKHGIVRGLSVGFRPLQQAYDKSIGGYRITKSDWFELSAVPVGVDSNAMITAIRSMDDADLSALGHKNQQTPSRNTAGVPAQTTQRGHMNITGLSQDIEQLRKDRTAIVARMTTAGEKAELESREMTADETREFDTAKDELRALDVKLDRKLAMQQAVDGASPVVRGVDQAIEPTYRKPAEVKSNVPKGNTMARAVICKIRGYIDQVNPVEYARRFYPDTPEVAMYLRAPVAVGDTTTDGWASQLVNPAQNLAGEFLDLLRPATIIGRIPGLRRVPFNIKVPLMTNGGTAGWVGEGNRKPATAMAVDDVTLRWAKAAAIVVITEELARFSSPAAEDLIRRQLVETLGRFFDVQFVHSGIAEVANVSPGSITNGISALTPSGTTAGDLIYDVYRLYSDFIDANQDPTNAVWLLHTKIAAGIALLRNENTGQFEFPGMSVNGGTLLGLPTVVSANVKDASGNSMILVNASDILIAEDPGVRVSVSAEASIEMDSAPTAPGDSPAPEATVLHSMFQENKIALRVERYMTWKRGRDTAVEWLDNAAYAPTEPPSPA